MSAPETAATALADAVRRLAAAGIGDPARDARRLLAHSLDLPAGRLTLALAEPMPADAAARFAAAIAQRVRHRPVAQITGSRSFWGRDFIVTADTLDPRPETETLIAAALARPAERVLDLGTGTGCILLTLLAEWPGAEGLGIDASAAALAVARRNAAALGLAGRARFALGDWAAGLAETFDLIVSNPPYIAADEIAGLAPDVRNWEPMLALSPGGDGLGAYRTLLPQAAARLAPGGRVMVEIGATQGPAVAAIGRAAGFEGTVLPDLDGRDRVVSFTFPAD